MSCKNSGRINLSTCFIPIISVIKKRKRWCQPYFASMKHKDLVFKAKMYFLRRKPASEPLEFILYLVIPCNLRWLRGNSAHRTQIGILKVWSRRGLSLFRYFYNTIIEDKIIPNNDSVVMMVEHLKKKNIIISSVKLIFNFVCFVSFWQMHYTWSVGSWTEPVTITIQKHDYRGARLFTKYYHCVLLKWN